MVTGYLKRREHEKTCKHEFEDEKHVKYGKR